MGESDCAMHNCAMDTDLQPIKAALSGLTDIELRAVIHASYEAPQTAPGLLAWLDSACHWELSRRAGAPYELQPPEAATPPEEDAVSIDAAIAMRLAFAPDSPAMRAFFDALVDLLTGKGHRH